MLNSNLLNFVHDIVPKMSSNSNYVGEVIAYEIQQNTYQCFDKNDSTEGNAIPYDTTAKSQIGVYIGFHFWEKHVLDHIEIPYVNFSTNFIVGTFVVEASNDGNNWNIISDPFYREHLVYNNEKIQITNKSWYEYFRIICTNQSNYGRIIGIKELNFYGY